MILKFRHHLSYSTAIKTVEYSGHEVLDVILKTRRLRVRQTLANTPGQRAARRVLQGRCPFDCWGGYSLLALTR